ncbi:MAG: HAMP domain-containing histidine kinase [Syntrophomonadaceae bacterium]|jgi:signal transduction histidine kinase|nr:HAMP domain-containing histidine kinase [Syntrophomonadaceae bacterium]
MKMKNKNSIKWQIFQYLIGFCLLLLMVLWLFQTVFLDIFYKSIKLRETEKIAAAYAELINNDNWDKIYDSVAKRGDISVEVWSPGLGSVLITPVANRDNDLPRAALNDNRRFAPLLRSSIPRSQFSDAEKYALLAEAESKGGKLSKPYSDYDALNSSQMEFIVYAIRLSNENKEPRLLLVSSFILPVNATVETLRAQLGHISVIMLILSIFIAWLISRKVSKPIILLNEQAKKLGKGDYEAIFPAKEYKEISELADTLDHSARELAKTDNLRKELIANVSHDLRTPLTLIAGYSEMIRDLPDENKPENMQVIIDESRRLVSLVNNLLDLSKLQSGTVKMDFVKFDLTAETQGIIHRFSRLCDQEGYTITFAPEKNVRVYADLERITQVIYNFLINAITFTGADKQVTVRQSIEGGRVKLEVADTGQGIAPEAKKDIWERYYKGNEVHKRSAVGNGLGLYIVKSILDQHPQILYGVESEPGRGSIFWFSTPVIPE